MGISLIIHGLTMALGHTVSGMSTDTLNEQSADGRKLLTPLEAYLSEEAKNNANESLSQQGKGEVNRTYAANKTAPALNWMGSKITRLREKDQRYRDQFFTIKSKIDNATERMLTFTYLWSKLDRLDEGTRVTRFLQAAERDEVTLMAAMLENPFSGPMVNEEVKERGLTERAKRLTPNDYHQFEQNQLLLEFLLMARNWIAQWLVEEVGVEPSVIRTNLGDDVPLEKETALAGV